MHFMIAKILLLLGLLGLNFASCRSSKPAEQNTTFEISQQEEGKLTGQHGSDDQQGQQSQQGQQQYEDNKDADSEKTSRVVWSPAGLAILHPKQPTAWFTRRLLMTASQPPASEIVDCRERIEAAVSDAPNLSALDAVALAIQSEVQKQELVYHWCFYQIMADLDIRLENDAPLMQDKAEIFLARMRALWVLGRSLDSISNRKIYIKYLRTRYTEISQTLFGRNLETVDLDSFSMPTVGAGKPASEFAE